MDPERDAAKPQTCDWSACMCSVGRGHDVEAFKQLFEFFAPRLKSYFARIGVPTAVAEDVAQDALLAVWRKAALYDPRKASAASWIFAIARNLYIDRTRRERHRASQREFYEPEPESTADEQLLFEDRERRVQAALNQLPPEQLTVVYLSFFELRTHPEIARTLGIPIGTVKSRSRLGMNRLRLLVKHLE